MTPLKRLKDKVTRQAMTEKLIKTPYCEGCNQKAITAHHIIRQKNSNYLRDKLENMISTCLSCHLLAHTRGDVVAFGQVFIKRGKKWHKKLIEDSRIIIKDNLLYWKEKIKQL